MAFRFVGSPRNATEGIPYSVRLLALESCKVIWEGRDTPVGKGRSDALSKNRF